MGVASAGGGAGSTTVAGGKRLCSTFSAPRTAEGRGATHEPSRRRGIGQAARGQKISAHAALACKTGALTCGPAPRHWPGRGTPCSPARSTQGRAGRRVRPIGTVTGASAAAARVLGASRGSWVKPEHVGRQCAAFPPALARAKRGPAADRADHALRRPLEPGRKQTRQPAAIRAGGASPWVAACAPWRSTRSAGWCAWRAPCWTSPLRREDEACCIGGPVREIAVGRAAPVLSHGQVSTSRSGARATEQAQDGGGSDMKPRGRIRGSSWGLRALTACARCNAAHVHQHPRSHPRSSAQTRAESGAVNAPRRELQDFPNYLQASRHLRTWR